MQDRTRELDRSFPRSRSGRVAAALLFSLIANGVLGVWIAYSALSSPKIKSENERSGTTGLQPKSVEALGRVQPAGGVISVFGPVGDRILELKVKLGAVVQKGESLADLNGDEERRLRVSALDAQIREAEALRNAIRAASDAKLRDLSIEAENATKAAQADLNTASAKIQSGMQQLAQAKREQQRLLTIEEKGVLVAAEQKEHAALLVTQAEQELQAARSQLAKAQEQLDSSPRLTEAKKAALAAETERGIAQVPFDSLKAAKAAAEQQLRDAALTAPITGSVVRLFHRTGDTLTNQPLLQIADSETMVVKAEIYENAVPTIRQWLEKSRSGTIEVEVDPRVLGGDIAQTKMLKGTLSAEGLSSIIAQNTVFALGPREDSDRRVLDANVVLDDRSSKAVANFIGLQVRAKFLPPQ